MVETRKEGRTAEQTKDVRNGVRNIEVEGKTAERSKDVRSRVRNIEVEGRTEERSTAMRNGVRKTEVRRSERHIKKSCASRYDRSFLYVQLEWMEIEIEKRLFGVQKG